MWTDRQTDTHTHSEYSVNLDSDSQKYICVFVTILYNRKKGLRIRIRETGIQVKESYGHQFRWFFFQTELSLSTIVGIILPPLTTSPTAKFNPWTGVRMWKACGTSSDSRRQWSSFRCQPYEGISAVLEKTSWKISSPAWRELIRMEGGLP